MNGRLFVWTTIAVDVLREITCRWRQVLIVLASVLLLSLSSPRLVESSDPPAWSDDFESGDFNSGWTHLEDFEVVQIRLGKTVLGGFVYTVARGTTICCNVQ